MDAELPFMTKGKCEFPFARYDPLIIVKTPEIIKFNSSHICPASLIASAIMAAKGAGLWPVIYL